MQIDNSKIYFLFYMEIYKNERKIPCKNISKVALTIVFLFYIFFSLSLDFFVLSRIKEKKSLEEKISVEICEANVFLQIDQP